MASQAIKFHNEAEAIFKEVLGTVADVMVVLAKAALTVVLPS